MSLSKPCSLTDCHGVIVLAGAWPGSTNGYRLALASSLRVYCRRFERLFFIGPSEEPNELCGAEEFADVQWFPVNMRRAAKWRRFLRSLRHSTPAVCQRYRQSWPAVANVMQEVVDSQRAEHQRLAVIFEDVPIACFADDIRDRWPDMPQALHSLNCLAKGFAMMTRVGNPMHRLAWRWEVRKIRRFEAHAMQSADDAWAITEEEVRQYASRLGVACDGVLGIDLDAGKYDGLEVGQADTVVHVGTADLRKGRALREFVRGVWPLVRQQFPQARFEIGGAGTEQLSARACGVVGHGRVADDRDILQRGAVFVNPQNIGAGIKLKSVVAMLAGRALVTTATGIEGIPGESGTHFLVVQRESEMADAVARLLSEPHAARRMGAAARELARRHYSREKMWQDFNALLSRQKAAPLQSAFPVGESLGRSA